MSDGGDGGRNDGIDGGAANLDAEILSEVEAALGDMSLMDLMDQRPASQDQPATEGVRRGTVVGVQRDGILIDLGGKSTGVLPKRQLGDEPVPNVGDAIDVTITGYDKDEGLLLLSRQDAVMAATWETLSRGQVVEGRVTGHNKGGLELKIDGIDAFMPISQVDRSRIEDEDLPGYINQRLRCQVVEVNRGDKKLVVSRRESLIQEAAQAREEVLANLTEGQVVTGTVRTIMPYGAFVDIGGVDGLLHVRDMGHGRIDDPKTVVQEGQELRVKVLKFDREEQKIALGLKQTLADPWTDAAEKWRVDEVVSGRVTKLMEFGAFLELEPGVEGLIPIGEMTFERRIAHPREIVSENEIVEVRVMDMDVERQRMSLSIKRVGDDPWVGASIRWAVDSVVEGTVTRTTDFGAFVELASGVEGLVHISELSTEHVRQVSEAVKPGDTVQAKVLDVDESTRRISLSIKQLAEMFDFTGDESAAESEAKPKPKRKKPLKGGLDW